MAFLTKTDLYSHLYQDVIDVITRADDTQVTNAIDTAIGEAKSYLSRYDLTALFGTDIVDPTFPDTNLKNKVKDIAIWHLLMLCNPNVSLELAEGRYRYAITYLRDIQKGLAMPDQWPYKDTTGETTPDGDSVTWQSNTKRNNYY